MVSIDAESGEATTVFQESDPHWINLEGDIEFLKDGKRFLWTSQRDGGFRHIFLSSNDGKSVKQLTKGNWEVTAINAVNEAEAGGRIYYTSSEPTPTERHLYTMKLDGSGKRQLTAANYTHNVSMSPTGAYLPGHLFQFEYARPHHAALRRRQGTRRLSRDRPHAGRSVRHPAHRNREVQGRGRQRVLRPPDQARGIRAGEEVSGDRACVRRSRSGLAGAQRVVRRQYGSGLRAQGIRCVAVREPRHHGPRPRFRNGDLSQAGRHRTGRPGGRRQTSDLARLCRPRAHRHHRHELRRLHDDQRDAQCAGRVQGRESRARR